MKLQEVLEKTTAFFKKSGIASARLDAELLLSEALGFKRIDMYLKFDYPMSEAELTKCRELVQRRSKGEPVAYIQGHKGFFKHDFFVTKDTLIPRPETELMVEEIIEWGKQKSTNDDAPLVIVDLGTGTGCIGLSLAAELKTAHVWLVDKSAAALEVATKNFKNLEELAQLHGRVQMVCTDAGEFEMVQSVDVVVANPPYIDVADSQVEENVRKFEPHMALFADDAELLEIRRWAKQAAKIARPGGLVIFEIGSGQKVLATNIFADLGAYKDIIVKKDYAGLDRYIMATKGE